MPTNIYVVPFQSRFFSIYTETPIVRENQEASSYIELCEIYEIGQDDFFCPLQIYLTKNPLLYSVIGIKDRLQWDSYGYSYMELRDNNLRSYDMTIDGKVYMSMTKSDDFGEEYTYCQERVLDLSPKNHKVLSCRLDISPLSSISLSTKGIISQINYIDMYFLYLQYHFNLSLINITEKSETSICFIAGKIAYIHNLLTGELLINHTIDKNLSNIIADFFTAASEIYQVEKLPNNLYILIECFFGLQRHYIKILKHNFKNHLLFFSVNHLIFKIENNSLICTYQAEESLSLNRTPDFIIYYLQKSFRKFAIKKWGFLENAINLHYKDFFKDHLWDFPIDFTVAELHYYFNGERLQLLYDNQTSVKTNSLVPNILNSKELTNAIAQEFGFSQTLISIHLIDIEQSVIEFSVNDIIYSLKDGILSIKYDSTIYSDDYSSLEKECWKHYISSQWGFPLEKIQVEKFDYQNNLFSFFCDGVHYISRKHQLTLM